MLGKGIDYEDGKFDGELDSLTITGAGGGEACGERGGYGT